MKIDTGKKVDVKEKLQETLSLFLVVTAILMVFGMYTLYKVGSNFGKDKIGSSITFTGEGEVFAVADIANFSFSVIEEAQTPTEAQTLASDKTNKALAYLKGKGIEDKDIKTLNYSVNPRYEWRNEGVKCIDGMECPPNGDTRVLVGYEVNQTVTVKLRDVAKSGEILAGLGELGISNIGGIEFTVDDEEELNRQARKLAIENAQEKAKKLSEDLGVRLVRVVSFSESGYYPRMMKSMVASDMALGMGGGVPEIPVGENKISSSISITYEIR